MKQKKLRLKEALVLMKPEFRKKAEIIVKNLGFESIPEKAFLHKGVKQQIEILDAPLPVGFTTRSKKERKQLQKKVSTSANASGSLKFFTINELQLNLDFSAPNLLKPFHEILPAHISHLLDFFFSLKRHKEINSQIYAIGWQDLGIDKYTEEDGHSLALDYYPNLRHEKRKPTKKEMKIAIKYFNLVDRERKLTDYILRTPRIKKVFFKLTKKKMEDVEKLLKKDCVIMKDHRVMRRELFEAGLSVTPKEITLKELINSDGRWKA